MNKVLLVGRLTRDPELRSLPSGKPLATFVVATNEFRGGGGERTEYHNVVAWDRLAEICGQFLSKGQMVDIEGRLQTRQWDDDAGIRHWKTEVVAASLEMLSGRGKKDYAREVQAAADAGGADASRPRTKGTARTDRERRSSPSPCDPTVWRGPPPVVPVRSSMESSTQRRAGDHDALRRDRVAGSCWRPRSRVRTDRRITHATSLEAREPGRRPHARRPLAGPALASTPAAPRTWTVGAGRADSPADDGVPRPRRRGMQRRWPRPRARIGRARRPGQRHARRPSPSRSRRHACTDGGRRGRHAGRPRRAATTWVITSERATVQSIFGGFLWSASANATGYGDSCGRVMWTSVTCDQHGIGYAVRIDWCGAYPGRWAWYGVHVHELRLEHHRVGAGQRDAHRLDAWGAERVQPVHGKPVRLLLLVMR